MNRSLLEDSDFAEVYLIPVLVEVFNSSFPLKPSHSFIFGSDLHVP